MIKLTKGLSTRPLVDGFHATVALSFTVGRRISVSFLSVLQTVGQVT